MMLGLRMLVRRLLGLEAPLWLNQVGMALLRQAARLLEVLRTPGRIIRGTAILGISPLLPVVGNITIPAIQAPSPLPSLPHTTTAASLSQEDTVVLHRAGCLGQEGSIITSTKPVDTPGCRRSEASCLLACLLVIRERIVVHGPSHMLALR